MLNLRIVQNAWSLVQPFEVVEDVSEVEVRRHLVLPKDFIWEGLQQDLPVQLVVARVIVEFQHLLEMVLVVFVIDSFVRPHDVEVFVAES